MQHISASSKRFVNRLKGREVEVWIEAEESIRQMEMIDDNCLICGS